MIGEGRPRGDSPSWALPWELFTHREASHKEPTKKTDNPARQLFSYNLFPPHPSASEVGDSNLSLETCQGVTSSPHQLLGHPFGWSLWTYIGPK